MSDETLTHKQRALAELELRRRETIKKLGPVYDWYGKPCMCSEYNPETKTCKKHPRALDHQRPPAGEWLAWLLMAGRSAGKTRSAAEWIRYQVESHAAKGEQIRIALVNETVSEVRRVQIEGASGLLAVSPPWFMPVYIPSKAEVVWPNGSVAYIYSGEQPDQLRGPQHHFAWCDELCLTPDTVITCVHSDKAISQVVPGDMVLTRAGYRPVVAAWKTTDSAVVYRLAADDGSSIVGTAGHPVWVEGEGWVPLANVKPGSILKILTSCREGSVGPRSVSVERLPERSPVYNIEVEGEHEYFANGILTHNCKWSKAQAAVWDNLLLGMRLGVNPQIVVSTTPQPTPTLRAIIADKFTVMSRASTYANRHNLPEKFFESVVSKYEGTRIGRQELHAEVLLQNQNALWNQEQLDALRVRAVPYGVDIKKVVVGVDPAGKIGDMAKFVHGMPTEAGKGDEAGIVVAGLGTDGHGYILGDHSTSGSPDAWGRAVAEAYGRHQANSVVWESNHGGDMVRDVLLAVNPNIVQKRVHASRSKYVRAEPIGALAEQGKIHIVGELPKLESEMCDFEPGGPSPNRMDAMVFALTDLMIQPDEEKVELEFRRTSFKGLF
jgi:phage terminase large subunit-like protein